MAGYGFVFLMGWLLQSLLLVTQKKGYQNSEMF